LRFSCVYFEKESLILSGNQMKTEPSTGFMHKNSTPNLFPLGNDETMPLMYLQIEDEDEVFLEVCKNLTVK